MRCVKPGDAGREGRRDSRPAETRARLNAFNNCLDSGRKGGHPVLNTFKLNVFKHGGSDAMYVVHSYVAYLTIAIAVTVWVARTLHRNGRAFLVEAFHGEAALADSVNHLLVVGFYLINVGWIVMTLRTHQQLDTAREAIELLSDKIGTVLFVLGLMHFFNLFLFSRFRRRAIDRAASTMPPIPPTGFFTPQESAR
jgi:hypothetical protein